LQVESIRLYYAMNSVEEHQVRVAQRKPLTFADAIAKVAAIREKETESLYINPASKTILLSHGAKVQKSVVLYHGFTNSPKQFEVLGQQLFELGYNVYIPRLKYHGHKSRTSKAMRHLTVDDLIEYVDDSIEIAMALGEDISVIGLSAGGTIGLWAGMTYKLKKVLAIAPVVDFSYYPQGFRFLAVAAMDLLPNTFQWWDNATKDKLGSPPQAYAWFSTRAMGKVFHLAITIERSLTKIAPRTNDFVFVLNEADQAASPARLKRFISKLRKSGAEVSEVIFAAADQIHHDMIDPLQPGQKIDIVYPRIIEALQ
jgi:esterase/lipase